MKKTKEPEEKSRARDARRLAFDPMSLVGSYFHSDAERGWQGLVVGEPSPSVYLVQVFSWIDGSLSDQLLVPLSSMMDWAFYDDDEYMTEAYTRRVSKRWDEQRASKPSGEVAASSG